MFMNDPIHSLKLAQLFLMEYCFLLFGILYLLSEAVTGDRGNFIGDGMSSAHLGDLCCCRGGEALEERRGDLQILSKTQR